MMSFELIWNVIMPNGLKRQLEMKQMSEKWKLDNQEKQKLVFSKKFWQGKNTVRTEKMPKK